MLSSFWPRDGRIGVIEIGPEQRVVAALLSQGGMANSFESRTLRCGKKHSLSVTQRRGISTEDKSGACAARGI
jgi:hypothetical protein